MHSFNTSLSAWPTSFSYGCWKRANNNESGSWSNSINNYQYISLLKGQSTPKWMPFQICDVEHRIRYSEQHTALDPVDFHWMGETIQRHFQKSPRASCSKTLIWIKMIWFQKSHVLLSKIINLFFFACCFFKAKLDWITNPDIYFFTWFFFFF